MGTEETRILQWFEEIREDSYISEVRIDKRDASIFIVPRTMRGKDCIYTPQVISMGPYHFLNSHLAEMEFEKSRIIERAVMGKLPPYFVTPLQRVRNGGRSLSVLQDNPLFGSVVLRCRDLYADAQFLQNLNEEAFAMMMFRDASFLLVFLQHHVTSSHKPQSHSDGSTSPFDGLKSGKGLCLDIRKDIIKLENQIPLSVLKSLYQFIGDPSQKFEDFVADKCAFYSPLWIDTEKNPPKNSDLVIKSHFLHCLHATVNAPQQPPVNGKSPEQQPVNGCFLFKWTRKHIFCLTSTNGNGERGDKKRDDPSRVNSKSPQQHPVNGMSPEQKPVNGCSLFKWTRKHIFCLTSTNGNGESGDKKRDDPSRKFGLNVLPSALKLSKAGVKFRHYEGGIGQIRFDKAESTLYLPVLKIGILSETIIRNLIAFESCTSEIEEKCVTSFSRFLEELIEDARDAEVLRTNGILVNWVGKDEKMVEIVKSLSTHTWKPYFKPVNYARSSLKAYYKARRWKILWSEFMDTYCSKPWVLVSAVAASLLLFMTALQVFCLFYTCNKNA